MTVSVLYYATSASKRLQGVANEARCYVQYEMQQEAHPLNEHCYSTVFSSRPNLFSALKVFPIAFVVAWAAVWTGLRIATTAKQVLAALKENDGSERPSWLDRYPTIAFIGLVAVTLAVFEATHLVTYYWVVLRLDQA